MPKLNLGLIGIVRLKDQPDPWAAIERIAAIGYRGLEACEPLLLDGPVDDNLRRFHALGLKVLTISAKPEQLDDDLPDIIRRAKAVHTDRVSCWWSPFDSRDAILRLADRFNTIGRQLADEGLTLCYHHHDHEFRNTFDGVTGFDLFAANTSPQHVRFVIDIAWAAFGGVDPAALLRRLGPRTRSLHVKDLASLTERGKFTAVGTGLVDTRHALETAIELGIDWAVVEQDSVRNLDPFDTIAACRLNLKEMGFVD